MIDEGYIKYRCDWARADVISTRSVRELTRYRDALRQLNLIGEYPDGIGFGNISQRCYQKSTSVPAGASQPAETPQFIISGTQTGQRETLTAADYALVTHFDPAQNRLTCQGLCQASSESLTHGVLYASDRNIGAVIHVHHPQLWAQLLNRVPTTRADVPYGTPAMAAETQRLLGQSELPKQKILAMAGHEDGIVTFGETLAVAYTVLMHWGKTIQLAAAVPPPGLYNPAALPLNNTRQRH